MRSIHISDSLHCLGRCIDHYFYADRLDKNVNGLFINRSAGLSCSRLRKVADLMLRRSNKCVRIYSINTH